MEITHSGNKTIKIKFRQEKFDEYLKSINSSFEELNSSKIKQIFLFAIKDFLSGELDLDELSAIGNKLYAPLLEMNIKDKDGSLDDVLEAASELSFYVREANKLKNFNEYIKKVLDFYEENSSLL